MARPDFSGDWILNRDSCTLSPGADGVQSGTLQIEHQEPTFRYKAEYVSKGGPLKTAFELQTDGREVVATPPGMSITSKLSWDGDALLGTWRIQRPDGELNIRFRYELIDSGRRLRSTEKLKGPGREQDNVWMFERAPK